MLINRGKWIPWVVICLAMLAIGWVTSDRFFSRTVCYEPGLRKCLRDLQVPMDSTMIDEHLLIGSANKVFGIPITWEISVMEIGSDFFAQDEILRFKLFKKKVDSEIFGSVDTRIVSNGSRLVLEAHKEKESRTVWMILEKE